MALNRLSVYCTRLSPFLRHPVEGRNPAPETDAEALAVKVSHVL